MKAVVFYESAAGLAEKAPLHVAEHRAWWREFVNRGELLNGRPLRPRAGRRRDGDLHHP